ncbi:hypothetical protein [Spirosoma foliorum]|uniref:Uncharacterized protein n=1 Tax=Spirosoma foliorum TaxID=2710596 RepID=A0A7G5GTU9_9BACT|nr:hypothetical protein [Spirosoma foliorum]QMW02291.1 hypothetical protein H3H32_30940 [Spirosoma foliorum]
MLPLITTKIKDDTLHWLCAHVRPGRMVEFNSQSLQETVGVDRETMNVVLEDFEEMGLISDLNPTRAGAFLVLKVSAHNLFQQGGFAVMDALNEANIQKVLLELENLQKQLKPDQVDAYNKVASLLSSIATIYTAFAAKS